MLRAERWGKYLSKFQANFHQVELIGENSGQKNSLDRMERRTTYDYTLDPNQAKKSKQGRTDISLYHI